jgi:hypothetical protein
MSHAPEPPSAPSVRATPETAGPAGALALAHGSAEWWREKHWNAHHHSQEMFKDVLRLRTALQAIADEASQHHEHNPISGKDRLPRGYTNILNLADAALNPPNPQSEPRL